MLFVGGLCFLLIGGINGQLRGSLGIAARFGVCAIAVTAVELLAGIVLNVQLKLAIWDYSHKMCNIMGQVCLGYCAYWYALSPVAVYFYDTLRHNLFGEAIPLSAFKRERRRVAVRQRLA